MPADGTPAPSFLPEAAEIVSPPKSWFAQQFAATLAEIEAVAAAHPMPSDPIRDDSDWPERVSLRRSVGLERDGF